MLQRYLRYQKVSWLLYNLSVLERDDIESKEKTYKENELYREVIDLLTNCLK